MDTKVKSLNRSLKAYDSALCAVRQPNGRIDIVRNARFGGQPPSLIFPLTDTFTVKGRIVDYGIEPIMARIRQMDLWRDDSMVDRLLADKEKSDAEKDRKRQNDTEAYLYENHSKLKRAWGDINTASMEKLYRKDDGHGYHKPRS